MVLNSVIINLNLYLGNTAIFCNVSPFSTFIYVFMPFAGTKPASRSRLPTSDSSGGSGERCLIPAPSIFLRGQKTFYLKKRISNTFLFSGPSPLSHTPEITGTRNSKKPKTAKYGKIGAKGIFTWRPSLNKKTFRADF